MKVIANILMAVLMPLSALAEGGDEAGEIFCANSLAEQAVRAESPAERGRVSERVFLTTDRPVYIAGDRVWFSAFSVDVADQGRLSKLSAIAYIELHSAEGMAQTAKVALLDGRGSGDFVLKEDLPTGNYRLVAYTKAGLNGKDVDYSLSSTTISVFNPSSLMRVKDGVIVENAASMPARALVPSASAENTSGNLSVEFQSGLRDRVVPVKIHNAGRAMASVSVSIAHEDLSAPQSQDIITFMASARPSESFSDEYVPEYDGEILRARVSGISPSQADSLAGKYAFISSPGDMAEVYSSPIASDATTTFFTNNIFGTRDLVCEIEGLPEGSYCHLEVISPFRDLPVGPIPELVISESQKAALTRRKSFQQIEKAFESEILYGRLPFRTNRLFGSEVRCYKLDDYKRFPDMSDVLIEILSDVRARSSAGKSVIQVRVQDAFRTAHYSGSESLVMLDGTPVFNHSKILSYDPTLIEKVNVYPYTYFIGSRAFSGVVDFVTYKKSLPSMDFDPNVRIVSFQGVSVPRSFTCPYVSLDSEYPDYRQLVYWHPLVEIGADSSVSFDFTLPSYKGDFVLKVEGVTQDGEPLRLVRRFSL